MNADVGVGLEYPTLWDAQPGDQEGSLTWLYAPSRRVFALLFYGPLPADADLQAAAQMARDETTSGLADVRQVVDTAATLADGRAAWRSEYRATRDDGSPIYVVLTSTARGGRLFSLMVFGSPESVADERKPIDAIATSLAALSPSVGGVPRDESLLLAGGESSNPRVYDPATGGGHGLVFSGLMMFTPQLALAPDLAESLEVSDDGTRYTFHLRPNARFHSGRPVTAQDVIYSWERAADPLTDSHTVLTYLGDIVGVRERRSGAAKRISGLRALDERTLEVQIDAPKPYFPMKLTYITTFVVDQANIESGPEWWRAPNGTGAYRLIRWEPLKVQLFERVADFYGGEPAIRYLVVQLYAGVGMRMYETGALDYTGVSSYDLDRVRAPGEPLGRDLVEGVSMCTSYISFDVRQPPFDDLRVRQAFALAVDKGRYHDTVLRGGSLQASGLFPPALPGYTVGRSVAAYDPEQARRLLAESKYGGAAGLPLVTFTSGGFGSDVDPALGTLIDMWQRTLGVTVQVENLEPNQASDIMQQGHHGQLFWGGWCADYPDPENFTDPLFHSEGEENLGNYANPALDQLLEQARVERDAGRRVAMYQQAEQLILDDVPAIFLSHGLSYTLVKPYIKGYVETPIGIPLVRYLSLDTAALE
ncbi:MAG: peptide ABC transporter substrate-binding protein [Chloroflexales bacterium]|nr:peptide ABC transporter substrate-binding protein [Chloroflexales bacterium]